MKTRTAEIKTFSTHDGQDLSYRAWPALSSRPAGAVIILHRGHEHSGRVAHLVHELNLPELAFFAWDARGHGLSPGERGHSPGVGTSLRDVQTFVDHIRSTFGFTEEEIIVIGQSVGAVLAAGWAHDYAPRIRGMILAAPAFRVKLYVPFARPALRLARAIRGDLTVNSYVKPNMLTHDPDRVASYKSDPLITRPISANMLLGLHDLSTRIIEDAQAITVPTQLLISGDDWVVRKAPQNRFFERLGSAVKEKHTLKGFYHDTFGEKDRQTVMLETRRFILERFAEPPRQDDLTNADREGHTRDEADALAKPLPRLSPRALYWNLTRLGLKIGGWFSDGIRVGHETGFDSGSMLDYVYRNEARGKTVLGRMIDRNYLDSIGWKGIRQRKVHIEELLGTAIRQTEAEGRKTRILDIAAGHGRYILEAVEQSGVRPASILLRDYSDTNVAAGRQMIAEKGLSDIARFARGDAFDPQSIADVSPQPTIGIVSGLYELFPDNALIRASLNGMSRAIPEGGYLVYTGQPWHPQIELIARALTSHRDGEPWVMRRRTQAEMDQLVAEAGFEKIEQRIDEWGIFSVSLARRVSAQGSTD